MEKNVSCKVLYLVCSMTVGFSWGCPRAEAVRLTTDEVFPHDLFTAPLSVSRVPPVKLLGLPKELLLTIFQQPVAKRLEMLQSLRSVCKYFKDLLDGSDLLVPAWNKSLSTEKMRGIKETLTPFLAFVRRLQSFQLNVELPRSVLSGMRQLIEKNPFPVTYFAFKGEAPGGKWSDIEKIFKYLSCTGSVEKLKITAIPQIQTVQTSPLEVFSGQFLDKSLENLSDLEIVMLKIPTALPVRYTLDLPPATKRLILKTNVAFDLTQSGKPAKRVKVEQKRI
jgi:hypothetical protein